MKVLQKLFPTARNPEERREHWEGIYASKVPSKVSWFQDVPRTSLDMIFAAGIAKDSWAVDVGGGASNLVDHLWGEGFRNLTVLDISSHALEHAQARMGHEAQDVDWVVGDVTLWEPVRAYALWHDRAVFHFLVNEEDRRAYKDVLERAVAPDGHVIIASFALDGPKKCSGLPVCQYSLETLSIELGDDFVLQDTAAEEHATPGGHKQKFVYCRFRRR